MFYVMHDVDIQQSNVTLGWGPVAVEREKHVLGIAFILDMKVKFSIMVLKKPTSKLVKSKYCKFFCNTVTVQFYF